VRNRIFDKLDKQILAAGIAAILGMLWSVSKIAAVHQQIDADGWWLHAFIAIGLAGSLLIVFITVRALRDIAE